MYITHFLIYDLGRILGLIVPMLLAVAYLTLFERKVLGAIQIRRGPNVVGFFGLLQPLADGAKLLFKELTYPVTSDRVLFYLAPMITFFLALMTLTVMPFSVFEVYFDFSLSIMLFFGLTSVAVYGIILSGWSGNTRYGFLGSLRSTAQMIAYEVSIGLIIQTCLLVTNTVSLAELFEYQRFCWLVFPLFPSYVLFLISSLAETNRPPFDLPEAEAELVSGYNVEYSAVTFALFFIGEYLNIIVSSILTVVLFLGGSSLFGFESIFIFSFKVLFMMYFFVWVRAALPRLRYDQLMNLGWKNILPFAFGWYIFVYCCVFCFDL